MESIDRAVKATLLIFMLPALAASADECGPAVDLRSPGQSIGDRPVISQGYGDTNTCGFFNSAWLIDAYRKKYGIGVDAKGELRGLTQPIGTAVALALERAVPGWIPLQITTDPLSNVPGRSGSLACDVIHYAREFGVCTDDSAWTRDLATSGHLSDKVAKIYARLASFARKSARQRRSELATIAAETRANFATLEPIPPVDELPSPEAIRELVAREESRPYAVIAELFFKRCREQHLALENLPKCKTRFFIGLDLFGVKKSIPRRVAKIRRHFEDALDAPSPLPVLFDYCSDLLWSGKKAVAESPLNPNCGHHWSLVIGKRKDAAGRCQYLVRNSYLPDHPYSKDWDQDGYDVWIGAEELARSIYAVSWLDEK
jgi:hypothetical protein